MGPIAVEYPRDAYLGGYVSPPVKEISSPRSYISYTSGSIARDAPTSSKASTSPVDY